MKNKPNIIMITGYAQAGKDTIADYLVDYHNYTKRSFAQPIYEMLAVMYGKTPEYIQEHKNDKLPIGFGTWREAMQSLGTEWGRDYIKSTIWVDLVVDFCTTHGRVVIPDCRYYNEYDTMTTEYIDAQLWHVSRPEEEPQTHHRSEQEIEKLRSVSDRRIFNDDSFTELYNTIENILFDDA